MGTSLSFLINKFVDKTFLTLFALVSFPYPTFKVSSSLFCPLFCPPAVFYGGSVPSILECFVTDFVTGILIVLFSDDRSSSSSLFPLSPFCPPLVVQ